MVADNIFHVFVLYLRECNIVSLIYCKFILKVTKIAKIKSSHWRCTIKKLFLIISQNSQENTCQSIFNKVARVSPATLLKKRLRQVSFSENFKNIFPASIYLLKVNKKCFQATAFAKYLVD